MLFVSVSGLSAVYVTNSKTSAEADPVVFTTVQANLGNMWSTNENKFTMASTRGLYYVAMAGSTAASRLLDFKLVRSGSPFASCGRLYTYTAHGETTAKDLLVELKSSDTLHMSTTTGIYSGDYSSLGIFSLTDAMPSPWPVITR